MNPKLLVSLYTVACMEFTQAEKVLDTKVPWSGVMRNVTFGELAARMRAWPDGTVGIDFKLAERLDKALSASVIDRFEVPDDPRPTYGELLRQAFRISGHKVDLSEGERGIVVTYLYARTFRLPFAKLDGMRRAGAFSESAIKGEMKRKGLKTSPHFVLTTHPGGDLLGQGTQEDLDALARLLGL